MCVFRLGSLLYLCYVFRALINSLVCWFCIMSVSFSPQPGEDEYTVVPDSKIVVSRTAHRDNTSAYSVNGKRATYKEVASLLRASGIDLDHNRFLILQVDVHPSSRAAVIVALFVVFNLFLRSLRVCKCERLVISLVQQFVARWMRD